MGSAAWEGIIPAAGLAAFGDVVEVYLHEQVKSGRMSLADAQQAIVQDWRGVYDRIPAADRDRLARRLAQTGGDEAGPASRQPAGAGAGR
jgi:hypothetical protein